MKRVGKITTIVVQALAVSIMVGTIPVATAAGYGTPSGARYNLNIIGVSKENLEEAWTNDGHRIFVPLTGNCNIRLQAGSTFGVLDYDGTDGRARLQLLDPYPGTATTSAYTIYVRALGKPGGLMTIASGFVDEYGNYWYSLENASLTRNKGKSAFSDKTLELTTIHADIADDGTDNPIRYNLFDNAPYNYSWSYDNNGMKLFQLRFYMA